MDTLVSLGDTGIHGKETIQPVFLSSEGVSRQSTGSLNHDNVWALLPAAAGF